jgi:uncharacterized membrane protein
MERVLVVVFDSDRKAYEGVAALRQIEREGSITAYAGAVVVKNADGTASIKQFDDIAPLEGLLGTCVDSLIALLAGPGRLGIGAASAFALIVGVGVDFVDEVRTSLLPTKVALVAEIEEQATTPVDTRMEALGGTVLRHAVSEVRQNLRNEHVAAMRADLAQLTAELSKARASRKKKLLETIDQLEARIDSEQKKIDRLAAFRAGQKAKGATLNNNAAAGRALKDPANTPL